MSPPRRGAWPPRGFTPRPLCLRPGRGSLDFMNTEFICLELTAAELIELYRALLARVVMEGKLRREQGLEPVDPADLLLKLEVLLNLNENQSLANFRQVDDELWEHSWLDFTDEWAWFRARQEVLKKLGRTPEPALKPDELEPLVEKCYQQNFDRYVAELDMRERPATPKKKRVRHNVKREA